jgi:Uma2 family endonuclease
VATAPARRAAERLTASRTPATAWRTIGRTTASKQAESRVVDLASSLLEARAVRDPETAEYESSTGAILDVMVAHSLIPLHEPSDEDEQRVLLHDVPWTTYVMLDDAIGSRGVSLTYLDGWLEIVTTSKRHEVSKAMLGRLIELFCLERDIPLFSYGHATLRKKRRKRGLEPDIWYRRGGEGWPAQIAIEVIVSSPLLDKLEVYSGLKIAEVWVYFHKRRALELFALRGDRYEKVPASEILPELDFARILHYLQQPDQHEALKAFRDELRETR